MVIVLQGVVYCMRFEVMVIKFIVKKIIKLKVVLKVVFIIKLIKDVLIKLVLIVYLIEQVNVEVKQVKVVFVVFEYIVFGVVYKKGVGNFMLFGLFKISVVKVLVKLKCKGKNFFIGEEQVFVVKLVIVKVKVCLFKKFKDVVI